MESSILTTETNDRNDLNLDENRLEAYAASEMADRGPKNVNPGRSGADTDAAALQGGNTNDEEGDEDYDDEEDDTDIEIDEMDADVEEATVIEDVDLEDDDLDDLDVDDEDDDDEDEVV